eukprot:NODE_10718_length_1333_cov_16.177446.p1 GENE.NODE_10718_length_1333_cov_16.177446~~NODE_10718_length_1333_cov_16.177446.p1  ORF type:complete len:346 (+),score=125.93 NODE_10718_length_1333_cov_16.177446:172-1209(+)
MKRPVPDDAQPEGARLAGKSVTIGRTQRAHYMPAACKGRNRLGVVFIHEPSTSAEVAGLRACERIAAAGAHALLPDFFGNKLHLLPGGAWEDQSSAEWLECVRSEAFLGPLRAEVEDAAAFLKKQGCANIGVFGLGIGGLCAEAAAPMPCVVSAVSLHGRFHTPETVKTAHDAEARMLYIEDASSPADEAPDDCGVGLNMAIEELNQACLPKARLVKLGTMDPSTEGINVLVKVLSEPQELEVSLDDIWDDNARRWCHGRHCEVLVGDETSRILLLLDVSQAAGLHVGKVFCVRNAAVRMVKGFMRLSIDKWGKLDLDSGGVIDEVHNYDLSKIEFELTAIDGER